MLERLQKNPLYLAVIALFGCLLFYAPIQTTSLWDNDEPTYAEIAKEMVTSGHWLTPFFNHEPWFCHPPLYMWVTAAIFKVFGWNEFTARFFPSLFAILGMLMIFKFASMWWDKKVGFLSALILGTSIQYLIQGGMATMDTMLNTFLLIAFYAAWRGSEERNVKWWILFFCSCALATLAKGIFGLAYPIFIFGLYLLATRQVRRWKEVPWKLGLVIYFLIAAPWFIYETWRNGNDFLHQVFYFYTFKRVVSPILRQSGPFYYYIPVLLFGFFPWSGFLPIICKKTWEQKRDPKILFLGVWTFATFAFFTLVHTKLPNYIFFLYPPLALLLAYFWKDFTRKEMLAGVGFSLVLLAFLVTALQIYAVEKLLPQELDKNLQHLWPILSILLVGVLAAALTGFFPRKNSFIFTLLVATMSLFWLTLHFQFNRIIESYKPMKPLAQALQQYRQRFPAPVLAYHVPGTASLIFYSDTPIQNLNNSNDFLKLWKANKYYGFLDDNTLRLLKPQMNKLWTLKHKRTLWLVANFNPN